MRAVKIRARAVPLGRIAAGKLPVCPACDTAAAPAAGLLTAERANGRRARPHAAAGQGAETDEARRLPPSAQSYSNRL